MSKRLQVLLDESEFGRLRQIAKEEGMTVSAWVRHVLRQASRDLPARRAEEKLTAIEHAILHEFPTADVDEMLAEIGRGYGEFPER